jgi:hypothetical protein
MPQADESVTPAVMDVFFAADDIPADEYTRKLLSKLLENPELLKSSSSDSLVECLVELLPFEAELVYELSHLLLRLSLTDRNKRQESRFLCPPNPRPEPAETPPGRIILEPRPCCRMPRVSARPVGA